MHPPSYMKLRYTAQAHFSEMIQMNTLYDVFFYGRVMPAWAANLGFNRISGCKEVERHFPRKREGFLRILLSWNALGSWASFLQ